MKHDLIEKRVGLLAVLIALVISVGGLMVLSGMFIMVYNVRRTIVDRGAVIDVPVLAPAH